MGNEKTYEHYVHELQALISYGLKRQPPDGTECTSSEHAAKETGTLGPCNGTKISKPTIDTLWERYL
jgi:hypothetical protein